MLAFILSFDLHFNAPPYQFQDTQDILRLIVRTWDCVTKRFKIFIVDKSILAASRANTKCKSCVVRREDMNTECP